MNSTTLKMVLLLVVVNLLSCVEPFEIPESDTREFMVVEGLITDDPTNYTVKVTRGLTFDSLNAQAAPFIDLQIDLFEVETDRRESLLESEPGLYTSSGTIQGQIGNSYFIRIETSDGDIFESKPEVLYPVGEVEEIRIEYEERVQPDEFLGEAPADVFNVFFDATAGAEQDDSFVRWRFTGTYEVLTRPELNTRILQGNGLGVVYFPDPLPCSGYIQVNIGTISTIKQIDECTCCTCWVPQPEKAPIIADGQLVTNGRYSNLKAAEVPINAATFYNKYLVEIEQMSLTKNAYDFFNLVKQQVEAAEDLFQPNPGEIQGNIVAVNETRIIPVGLFWATSITKKSLFIDRSDIPYNLLPIDPSVRSCLDVYPNSTNIKPEGWD